jgi:hypothetical protein
MQTSLFLSVLMQVTYEIEWLHSRIAKNAKDNVNHDSLSGALQRLDALQTRMGALKTVADLAARLRVDPALITRAEAENLANGIYTVCDLQFGFDFQLAASLNAIRKAKLVDGETYIGYGIPQATASLSAMEDMVEHGSCFVAVRENLADDNALA